MKYIAATLICLLNTTSAFAQVSSAGSGESTVQRGMGQAQIGDIVVTASRRAESVQKAALSIQALSSDVLVRANITNPEGLTAVAPGVTIGTLGDAPQVYIRGIGNFLGNSYSDAAVPFSQDGVVISNPWAARGIFYDLERVEILKGPQGTLYGRNATGGAVNVITAKPQLDRINGFAEFQAGNYSLLQGTAALNIPLGETVAVRASGRITSRDGYLSDGFQDDEARSARLQLLWKPNSDLSLLLHGNYQHVDGKGGGGALLFPKPSRKFLGNTEPEVATIIAADPIFGPALPVPQPDGYVDLTVKSIGAELNMDMGFATLTVLPAYRDGKLRNSSYSGGFYVENNVHDKQTSVEVRLGDATGGLKWTLGGFYFNQEVSNIDGSPVQAVYQGISAQSDPDFHLKTLSYAVFGQATYSVSDRLRMTGGLRYTYERKKLDGLLNSYAFPTGPGTCNPGYNFDAGSFAPPLFCRLDIPLTGRLTYKNVSFKAGAEFDLAPQSMVYANISTGFKSGSFYDAPPPNTYKPEKLTSFEVGIKNRFFDNRLQVNIEAFYWKYKDLQEAHVGPSSNPNFFAFLTENAGSAETYGVDLDILARPTPNDEVNLKVQYNKSKFITFEYSWLSSVFGPPVLGCSVGPLAGGSQTVDCRGLPLPRAPKWSGTAGYSHVFDLGEDGSIRVGADMQFASESFLSIDFLPAATQKAYAIGNVKLEWESADEHWSVAGFVDNFTNEAIASHAFRSPFSTPLNPIAGSQGIIFGTLRPPRTFGGRIRYSF